jgi:hypothetical protein
MAGGIILRRLCKCYYCDYEENVTWLKGWDERLTHDISTLCHWHDNIKIYTAFSYSLNCIWRLWLIDPNEKIGIEYLFQSKESYIYLWDSGWTDYWFNDKGKEVRSKIKFEPDKAIETMKKYLLFS